MDSDILYVGAEVDLFCGAKRIDAVSIVAIENDDDGLAKVVRVKSLACRPGEESEFGIDPEGGSGWLPLTPDPLSAESTRTFNLNSPSFAFKAIS
jgi:hypothetical protein